MDEKTVTRNDNNNNNDNNTNNNNNNINSNNTRNDRSRVRQMTPRSCRRPTYPRDARQKLKLTIAIVLKDMWNDRSFWGPIMVIKTEKKNQSIHRNTVDQF